MNKHLLNKDIQQFIDNNLDENISKLLLKGSPFESINIQSIVEQIEAKKRSKHKLPTWFHNKNIYYPNKLNIEQTSSELTAKYKSELIDGKSIIDITGGFGVDSYYFSKKFSTVIHCEINQHLSEIVKHNFKQLQVNNIEIISENGINYISKFSTTYDWIYIDPSRRHDNKGKVFKLKDCAPNVPEHLEFFFEYTENILIKTSPLLDISLGVEELQNVKTIIVVAVNNEVKELLWILKKDYHSKINIQTVNHTKQGCQYFDFIWNNEPITSVAYEKPLKYLYEPNAAIMKSGGFNIVSENFGIYKLHKHSHLYTSNNLLEFPGRKFLIKKILPCNKKAFKKEGLNKANITTRNFPESVNNIRKKFKIVDGGNIYLFFTTDAENQKVILICDKV